MGKLVCEICGGSLLMNADNVAECESCGMKYAKEKVTQMVKIDGAVEITKGEAEKARLLKNAEVFVELGDVLKAKELYAYLTNEYPDDYRGWLGRLKILLEYGEPSVYNLVHDCQKYSERISKLGYSDLSDALWKNFLEKRLKMDFQILEKSHTKYFNTYSIIDSFSAELICFDTELLNDKLRELQSIVGSLYVKKFLNGDVLSFSVPDGYGNPDDYLWNVKKDRFFHSDEKIQVSAALAPIFNIGKENAKRLQNLPSIDRSNFIKSLGVESFYVHDHEIFFLLGKTLVYGDGHDWSLYIKEINRVVTEEEILRAERRRDFVCQYCGGEIKGLFKERCSVCGKEKDY